MTIRLSFLVGQLIAALAMLAVPHISRRDLLFGVPIPEGFRSTEAGRAALRAYRLWIGVPAAIMIAATMLAPPSPLGALAVLPITVLGIYAFVAQNRKLKPFAIQPPLVHQTALRPAEPLPRLVWLGVIPLMLLAGTALYLHAHWDQIPLRYPVHYDITGMPNRWVDRTPRGVYGTLIFGGEFALLMFGFALAGWYGSRRSEPMRKPMLWVMIAVEWTLALLFCGITLKSAAGIPLPLPLMVLGPLAVLIPAMWYLIHESNKPRDLIDPTPNECWKGGIIYYNPNDAVLFVQRRDGIGFTVNMANRWSWALYGSLLLVIASGLFVLH